MRDVDPDTSLEQRLRAALREEGAAAGPPVSHERLQAAAREHARRRRGWRMTAAAAVAVVAVASTVAVAPLLAPPSIDDASPLPTEAPPPSDQRSPAATAGPTPVAVSWPFDVPLRCGEDGPTFESYILSAPTGGENERHPSAAALRSALGTTVDGEYVPVAGYVLVARDATIALYLTQRSTGYFAVRVRPVGADGASRWSVEDADVCQPELALGVARGAEWELDPSAGEPTAESTTLSLLVRERACASGRSPEGRIREPFVREAEGWVGIGWAIEPLPGGQDCQGNPSVARTVDLSQPLGDRVLLDLGRFPFAKAPVPGPASPTPSSRAMEAPALLTAGPDEVEVSRFTDETAVTREVDVDGPQGTDTWLIHVACTGAGAIDLVVDGIATRYPCPLAGQLDSFVPDATDGLAMTVRATDGIRWSLLATAYDIEASAAWIPPRAVLSAPEWTAGDIVEVNGYPGCGWSWQLANGESAAESCGPSWMPVPTAVSVRPGADLTLVLADGWTITAVSGDIAVHDRILPTRSPASVALVAREGPASHITFPAPAIGDWGVLLLISGERAGDVFGVPYYFRIIVEP